MRSVEKNRAEQPVSRKEQEAKPELDIEDFARELSRFASAVHGGDSLGMAPEKYEAFRERIREEQEELKQVVVKMERNKGVLIDQVNQEHGHRLSLLVALHGILDVQSVAEADFVFQAKDIAAEIIAKSLDTIQQGIEQQIDDESANDFHIGIALNALRSFADYSAFAALDEDEEESEKWRALHEKAVATFENNKETFFKKIQEYTKENGQFSILVDHYLPALQIFLLHGSKESAKKSASLVAGVFDAEEWGGAATSFVTDLVKRGTSVHVTEKHAVELRGRREAGAVLGAILEKYNFDKSIAIDWSKGTYLAPEHLGDTMRANLVALKLLEKDRPGSARTLYEQFGIRHFARYPREMLVAQFDQIDNMEIPYGVVMFPVYDENGVFAQQVDELASLGEQLGDDYAVRFFESKGTLDATKKILRADKKYGSYQKIAFGIVGAHGNWDDPEKRAKEDFFMLFSVGDHQSARLRVADLEGATASRIKNAIQDDADFLLISCSSGHPEGIAETWANMLGASVVAPDLPNRGIERLRAVKDGNKVHLDAHFPGANKKVYIPG